ncbi:hypothetical protein AB1Y20_022908 [Prymnesium parvum]|uniref:Ubiquitin carboxyl-terminal hydrolase n=1 Tax=Prymnesium parvum TaxID=97485 RepID=A0AB34JEQ6_PRYPA
MASDGVELVSVAEEEPAASRRPLGLQNWGNTCYINAVLQALAHCPEMQTAASCIAPFAKSAPQLQHAFLRAITELMRGVESSSTMRTYDPGELILSLREVASHLFSVNEQQDAHELLRVLLDSLHEQMCTPLNDEELAKASASNSERWHKIHTRAAASPALGAWTRQRPSCPSPPPTPLTTSVIEQIMEGQVVSSVQCGSCRGISSTADRSLDLSVELASRGQGGWRIGRRRGIPRSQAGAPFLKLEDCLRSYFAVEQLGGVDRYRCEGCAGLRDARKSLRLLHVPPLLTIHLKRFSFTSEWGRYEARKACDEVRFPLERLCLREFCYSFTGTNEASTEYDLSAVVVHHGTSPFSGHYTAYVKREHKWFHVNDTVVNEVSKEEVRSAEAFLLFYSRRPHRQSGLTRPAAPKMYTGCARTIAGHVSPIRRATAAAARRPAWAVVGMQQPRRISPREAYWLRTTPRRVWVFPLKRCQSSSLHCTACSSCACSDPPSSSYGAAQAAPARRSKWASAARSKSRGTVATLRPWGVAQQWIHRVHVRASLPSASSANGAGARVAIVSSLRRNRRRAWQSSGGGLRGWSRDRLTLGRGRRVRPLLGDEASSDDDDDIRRGPRIACGSELLKQESDPQDADSTTQHSYVALEVVGEENSFNQRGT